MPPKAAGKAKKSKKTAKPGWMADEVWAVSQDLPALLNSFVGLKSDQPSKSKAGGKSDRPATPGKAGKGAKPEPLPNIPKAQVLSLCSSGSSLKQFIGMCLKLITVVLCNLRVILLLSHCSKYPTIPAGWPVPVAATATEKGSCSARRAAQAGHCRSECDSSHSPACRLKLQGQPLHQPAGRSSSVAVL